ncbi:hypothetical protein PAUR_b0562 [Pseudoalteromonas aurantia 208]|uniref:Uncharacterized protein n=1 Tax=Pseudoalteromonas aurantia 208 TaxID=1314867 RepID=A0ABR9EI56_9GAMM|nr:hypothetical protein [Pseudoalteromonas aurantia 208]
MFLNSATSINSPFNIKINHLKQIIHRKKIKKAAHYALL